MTDYDDMTDYSAENIRVLTGLEAIRQRPRMYVGNRPIQGAISTLCAGVAECSNSAFEVYRGDDFVVITSDTDWLAGHRPIENFFNEIGYRYCGEAIVAALSAAYFTDGPAGQVSANMTFDDIPSEYRARIAGKTRFLIFDIRSPYFQPVSQETPEL